MGQLVERVHDPLFGEFPCERACEAVGDALWRVGEAGLVLETAAFPGVEWRSRKHRGSPIWEKLASSLPGKVRFANVAGGFPLIAAPGAVESLRSSPGGRRASPAGRLALAPLWPSVVLAC